MFPKKIIAILLSLMLMAGMATPVSAQTSDITMLEPFEINGVVMERLEESGPMEGDTADYMTTQDEVAEALRQGLERREPSITVYYSTFSYSEWVIRNILDKALEHTGSPTQGDYLHWHLSEYSVDVSGYSSRWSYYLTIVFTPVYLTTAQQEAQMDVAVKSLLDQLDVYTASDYKKICAIYDYICENVVYDYDEQNEMRYTAYNALIEGKAVCQGYASLFYRLALELGVDTRVIPGIGNGGAHGWNIVKLGGKYYNVDATWDAVYKQEGLPYEYFLLCEENFDNHRRDVEYDIQSFHNTYPISEQDYTMHEALLGDINEDFEVTRNDVIILLLHVTMPSRFPIDAEADFNGDGQVTRDDVIRLLLHVTMPGRFPL